jgi:hypothetical protein
MISISQLIFEIKNLINDEDKKSFQDLDSFLKISAESMVKKLVKKERFSEFFVKAIPVSDFMAVLPKHNKLVQISGSDTQPKEYAYTGMLRTDVVAWMRKSSDDKCIYTVYKNCTKCGKDDCNEHEILLNANSFAKDLARGANYNLIKTDYDRTHYGYKTDENGCKRSLINNTFYLMHPTESKQFGIQEQYIEECINYQVIPNEFMGDKWDYKIMYHGKEKEKVVKTNFKEGVLLISYYSDIYDDEGYRMLPDMPDVIQAIKNYTLKNVFEKLKNDYKTNDYRSIFADYDREFMISFKDAENELSEVPLNELIMTIARNKYHSKLDQTFHSLTQTNYPDKFNDAYNKSFDY